MDATWGRGKFREEVWTGEVNPADDWWLAYTPSEEEQQAANAGYDFRNAKEWFQVIFFALLNHTEHNLRVLLERRRRELIMRRQEQKLNA